MTKAYMNAHGYKMMSPWSILNTQKKTFFLMSYGPNQSTSGYLPKLILDRMLQKANLSLLVSPVSKKKDQLTYQTNLNPEIDWADQIRE